MAQQTAPTTAPSTTPAASHRGPGARARDDVQAFLDSFAHALTHGHSHAIASLWETPAFVLGDNDARDVRAIDEVEHFFNGAKRQYNEQGIVDTRPEIISLDWLTERIVLVRVRWPYLDAAGREVGAETSTYTLRRDREGQLRLRVAVMHGIEPATTH